MPLKYTLTFAIFLSLCIPAQAQQKATSKPERPAILLKARAQEHRILLRWAVNQPAAWKLANQYGFMIERYTVLKNGHAYTVKDGVEKVLLTKAPLKPYPLEKWADIMKRSDDAAVIAQGLYGESFTVTGGKQDMATIVNMSNEQEQRFSFSLLAADRNFEAAQMAGWGYVDNTANPDEKYVYRIYTVVPATKMKIDTAGVFIGIKDFQPLPQPKDLYGNFGDKTVMLSWNYRLLKDVYSSYYIERSTDGTHFTKLSDLPVINLNENDARTPSRMFYTDTLQENNQQYYYRVTGLTSFGESGPPSAVTSGSGKQMLAYVPNIKAAGIINESSATLEWEFAKEGETLIDHFELDQSADATQGSYKTINNKIKSVQRKITVNSLMPVNYFIITAVDKNGNKRSSFPYLVQPVDSVPPATPADLTAVIDSAGHVTLKWKDNTEPDLKGYVILKSNLKNEEAAVLNEEPVTIAQFRDSVGLRSLNSKVYYAVMALDQRLNRSKPTPFVEVTKPDKIPPVSPVFKGYDANDGHITLSWINSSSADVATHKLYRKNADSVQAPWILVKEFPGKETAGYTDGQVVNGQTYLYNIVAVDNSNNVSLPAPTLTVTVFTAAVTPAVKNLQAAANRTEKRIEVSWGYNNNEVVEYQVYKAVNKGAVTLWKVVNANIQLLNDTEIFANNNYRYAVRAVLKNGRMSKWTEVKVAY
ncbi:fibronectin type III domain-containing protein [Chitinophaga flava]|uniref:Fibronectin type-III domain-containing protein n=1 Tax=Chitinophaga flava TaxID=2259036 RepID=A0A365XTT2_9BACT|nr:hypothetical protein [Chitinophaga flava]RBL89431.1 hypothetical protein DF182_23215 [Chitinophaga flava]